MKPHPARKRADFLMVSVHKRVYRTLFTGGKQRYAATRACALPGVTWDGINWANVQRYVRGLQMRIVKATQDGRHNKVKALQWLLTHSFSGKALAVKRVTTQWCNRVSKDAFVEA